MKDYGPSDYNRKSASPDLSTTSYPARRRARAHYVLGGWQLNGIVILQTGGPLNYHRRSRQFL